MAEHPRTLVLTESPFSSTNGFGVTLATLFAEWPRDRLLVLYRSKRFWDDTCVQLRETRDRMVHMPLPGRPLLNPVHLRELRGVLLPYLAGRTPSWFGRYSRGWIDRTLSGWEPDVIYSWFYSPVIADYGAWLSRTLGIPHVAHVGDDATHGKRPAGITDALRTAAARIAISEEMKADFESRFDVPFDVVHNGAAAEIFAGPPGRGPEVEDGELVIRYVGSLVRSHHGNASEDIAAAVGRYNDRGGRARLEIYCSEWTAELARELARHPGVVYSGFAEKPRNYELLGSADLLVLPITFDEREFPWVRLSMPTKLPEYLGSGTPTLVYGPRGVAPVEFCIRNDVGIVQAERSVDAIVAILERLAGERDAFRERAARDRELAEARVSAPAMRERLARILRGVVDGAGDAAGSPPVRRDAGGERRADLPVGAAPSR